VYQGTLVGDRLLGYGECSFLLLNWVLGRSLAVCFTFTEVPDFHLAFCSALCKELGFSLL